MRLFTVLIALALGACATTPNIDVTPSVSPSVRLAAEAPVNIAVIPVYDNSAQQSASWLLDDMRQAAEYTLPTRRYSPMATQWVDQRLVTAAVPASLREPSSVAQLRGRFEEDAILAIMVNQWDEADLMRSARVHFDLEAALLGGDNGETLWSGRLHGSIKAGADGPAPRDRRERARDVARRAVEALVELIDPRK